MSDAMRTIIEFNMQTGVRTERLMTDEEIAAIPVQSIESLQSEKWQQIKAERDRRKSGGVKVGDKWFHSDDASRIQHIGLVLFGENVPQVSWKTMDGTKVQMTQLLAQAIFQSVAAADQAIFAKAEQHKDAMMSSPDPASYDISTGWPLIYGEE